MSTEPEPVVNIMLGVPHRWPDPQGKYRGVSPGEFDRMLKDMWPSRTSHRSWFVVALTACGHRMLFPFCTRDTWCGECGTWQKRDDCTTHIVRLVRKSIWWKPWTWFRVVAEEKVEADGQ